MKTKLVEGVVVLEIALGVSKNQLTRCVLVNTL